MNILITGAWSGAERHIAKIESFGHKVFFQQHEKEKLICDYKEIDAVICNGLFISHPIERFESLSYIQLTSAGFDRVPMDYVRKHDIKIYNARGVYSIPMAEFVISGVLQLYKKTRSFYNNQRKRRWTKDRGLIELNDKTVCIVGCGSVGAECAKRFMAFGCEVIGIDIKPYQSPFFARMETLEQLNQAMSVSDIVVLTLPLTAQTRHLMNRARFEKMKKGSILVNIARGAVVDTMALEEALVNNLGGAILDVFEEEPLDESNILWDMENVIITPHNSFVSDGNPERLAKLIEDNLLQFGSAMKHG